jgi:hypothetical protein
VSEADAWAEIVSSYARNHDLRYEPVGGINPKDGPVALCVGGTNRLTGQLGEEFWGSSCDADEEEVGGLFRKTVVPGAVLAKAHMPDLAQVMPAFNVESIEARPADFVAKHTARKVEFESIDFNRRYLATVPADHDPVALRELFSPGFLDWAAQIRNEVEFGITDRQLYFTWRLSELSEREYGDALDHASGLFKRLRNEMEEHGLHTYQPGPWHAGLEPFPDAAPAA